MQGFLFLEHLIWVHMQLLVGCESLSPSQLRLYGLHKIQAVLCPLSWQEQEESYFWQGTFIPYKKLKSY